jgi:hypothetical protein
MVDGEMTRWQRLDERGSIQTRICRLGAAPGGPGCYGAFVDRLREADRGPGALILTDGWQAYASLPELGYRHRPRTQGTRERAAKLLPHIQRVFAISRPGLA